MRKTLFKEYCNTTMWKKGHDQQEHEGLRERRNTKKTETAKERTCYSVRS